MGQKVSSRSIRYWHLAYGLSAAFPDCLPTQIRPKPDVARAEKRTPISRTVSSEQTTPWRRWPPVRNLFPLRLQSADHARFFNLWLRTNRARHPSRSSDQRSSAFALAASPPQKNVGAAACPRGCSHSCGCQYGGANPSLAHHPPSSRVGQTSNKPKPLPPVSNVLLFGAGASVVLVVAL